MEIFSWVVAIVLNFLSLATVVGVIMVAKPVGIKAMLDHFSTSTMVRYQNLFWVLYDVAFMMLLCVAVAYDFARLSSIIFMTTCIVYNIILMTYSLVTGKK